MNVEIIKMIMEYILKKEFVPDLMMRVINEKKMHV